MNRLFTPRLMMVLSMLIFGTLGVFVRNINISSGQLALYRALMAAILILVFLVIKKESIPFLKIKKEIPLLLISGVTMGVNWILLFQAYKYTTVSVATLSYYFAPVIVTIVCPLIFKEKVTLKQIICFLMATIGIALITGFGEINSNREFLGVLLGLGAALFYASVIIINKFIKNVEGIYRTFLQFVAAIAVLIPYVGVTDGLYLTGIDFKGIINLLIVGFFHTGITYCLYFSALKSLSGQKAAILSYIDPLVAVFASVLILGEKMTVVQSIGGLLILGFTLINEINTVPEFLSGRNK